MHPTRAQLRSMLLSVGYEPVMSDQADVIFDPRVHTHTSCLREVMNCDVVILLVGSRFGGTIIPKALESIDIDRLPDISRADHLNIDDGKISITQAEVLQAIQTGLPVFAFIDSGVMRDHLTYEKNKNKSIIKEIEFSSIDKPETAAYIFEFINFLRLRNENNSLFEFSRFEDIELQLKKQWAGLFQRLLQEQRMKMSEGRRIDNLSSQIADLKAAVLGSISSDELKKTAKGAIRFRQLVEFVYSLENASESQNKTEALNSEMTWPELLDNLGIIKQTQSTARVRNARDTVLIRKDGTYYRTRFSLDAISRLESEWDEFRAVGTDAKEAIINAILDSLEGRPPLLKHYSEPFSNLELENDVTDPGSQINERATGRSFSLQEHLKSTLQAFFDSRPELLDKFFTIATLPGNVDITVLSKSDFNERWNFRIPFDVTYDSLTNIQSRLIRIISQNFTSAHSNPNPENKKD